MIFPRRNFIKGAAALAAYSALPKDADAYWHSVEQQNVVGGINTTPVAILTTSPDGAYDSGNWAIQNGAVVATVPNWLGSNVASQMDAVTGNDYEPFMRTLAFTQPSPWVANQYYSLTMDVGCNYSEGVSRYIFAAIDDNADAIPSFGTFFNLGANGESPGFGTAAETTGGHFVLGASSFVDHGTDVPNFPWRWCTITMVGYFDSVAGLTTPRLYFFFTNGDNVYTHNDPENINFWHVGV